MHVCTVHLYMHLYTSVHTYTHVHSHSSPPTHLEGFFSQTMCSALHAQMTVVPVVGGVYTLQDMEAVIQQQRKHEPVWTSVRASWWTGSCPVTKYYKIIPISNLVISGNMHTHTDTDVLVKMLVLLQSCL